MASFPQQIGSRHCRCWPFGKGPGRTRAKLQAAFAEHQARSCRLGDSKRRMPWRSSRACMRALAGAHTGPPSRSSGFCCPDSLPPISPPASCKPAGRPCGPPKLRAASIRRTRAGGHPAAPGPPPGPGRGPAPGTTNYQRRLLAWAARGGFPCHRIAGPGLPRCPMLSPCRRRRLPQDRLAFHRIGCRSQQARRRPPGLDGVPSTRAWSPGRAFPSGGSRCTAGRGGGDGARSRPTSWAERGTAHTAGHRPRAREA